MIDDAITFLRNRLNRSLRGTSGGGPSEDKVEFVSGDRMDPISFKSEAISALLINVEKEDTLPAADLNGGVDDNGVRQKVRPEIRLNLLLLFVAQFKEYGLSLAYLSAVIRHFQNDSVFTPQNAPELSDRIDELVVELVTLPFSEQSLIWGSLRATYRPSVLYRVKTIVFKDRGEPPPPPVEDKDKGEPPLPAVEEPETPTVISAGTVTLLPLVKEPLVRSEQLTTQ
jgi:Pvc16 N-terminal domain